MSSHRTCSCAGDRHCTLASGFEPLHVFVLIYVFELLELKAEEKCRIGGHVQLRACLFRKTKRHKYEMLISFLIVLWRLFGSVCAVWMMSIEDKEGSHAGESGWVAGMVVWGVQVVSVWYLYSPLQLHLETYQEIMTLCTLIGLLVNDLELTRPCRVAVTVKAARRLHCIHSPPQALTHSHTPCILFVSPLFSLLPLYPSFLSYNFSSFLFLPSVLLLSCS